MEIKDDLQNSIKDYIDVKTFLAKKLYKLLKFFLTISITVSIIGIIGAILSVFL